MNATEARSTARNYESFHEVLKRIMEHIRAKAVVGKFQVTLEVPEQHAKEFERVIRHNGYLVTRRGDSFMWTINWEEKWRVA